MKFLTGNQIFWWWYKKILMPVSNCTDGYQNIKIGSRNVASWWNSLLWSKFFYFVTSSWSWWGNYPSESFLDTRKLKQEGYLKVHKLLVLLFSGSAFLSFKEKTERLSGSVKLLDDHLFVCIYCMQSSHTSDQVFSTVT